ncbi:MAG: hypothetical protein HRT76_13585 [Halieaceae bacterium]|nr:hypothetical protein [Halieaceae bacterium]
MSDFEKFVLGAVADCANARPRRETRQMELFRDSDFPEPNTDDAAKRNEASDGECFCDPREGDRCEACDPTEGQSK